MPRVANRPRDYVTRADLSKVGVPKKDVRKPKNRDDVDRKQLMQRLSVTSAHGEFVGLRSEKKLT